MKIQTLPVNLFLRRYGPFLAVAFCGLMWWVLIGSFR